MRSSCSCGVISTIRHPTHSHRSRSVYLCAGAEFSVGVRMQTAPSKRFALAAPKPLCSEPAIGCEPTNRLPRLLPVANDSRLDTAHICDCRRGQAPERVVRQAGASRRSACRRRKYRSETTSVASRRQRERTCALFPPTVVSAPTHADSSLGRDCNASASEPPIRPGPKMATVLRGQGRFYSCRGT